MRKVPQLDSFSLQRIETKGVTSAMIERAYYAAWIFLASNILQKSPESGYEYTQFACGKPSLWGQGAPEAPYSASWESLIAMQLYASIYPEQAWDAFKGLMSLVDDTGMLAGESLPSRKAQTAFILYEATGNKQLLSDVYPALKKYME